MLIPEPLEHPQTIQIFLPTGNRQANPIAAITTRIVQVIKAPRLRLDDFLKMPEAGFVGIFFLFGEADETGTALAYRALVAFSLTRSRTVTRAYFLE